MYQGKDFPCHGVQRVYVRYETAFRPWAFDGKVVWYGPWQGTYSEAMEVARSLNHCPKGSSPIERIQN